mmetsp:Transcript_19909/g.57866  ORF Transcript_19909/g.57866 Transcript_19909/m.57866 type:complete len:281 (+) Transcript_19909:104-946(+)
MGSASMRMESSCMLSFSALTFRCSSSKALRSPCLAASRRAVNAWANAAKLSMKTLMLCLSASSCAALSWRTASRSAAASRATLASSARSRSASSPCLHLASSPSVRMRSNASACSRFFLAISRIICARQSLHSARSRSISSSRSLPSRCARSRSMAARSSAEACVRCRSLISCCCCWRDIAWSFRCTITMSFCCSRVVLALCIHSASSSLAAFSASSSRSLSARKLKTAMCRTARNSRPGTFESQEHLEGAVSETLELSDTNLHESSGGTTSRKSATLAS